MHRPISVLPNFSGEYRCFSVAIQQAIANRSKDFRRALAVKTRKIQHGTMDLNQEKAQIPTGRWCLKCLPEWLYPYSEAGHTPRQNGWRPQVRKWRPRHVRFHQLTSEVVTPNEVVTLKWSYQKFGVNRTHTMTPSTMGVQHIHTLHTYINITYILTYTYIHTYIHTYIDT